MNGFGNLGQIPSIPIANEALAVATNWPPDATAESLVGRLSVRLDGTQIVRLGWTFTDTDHFKFQPGAGPWTSALVFEGAAKGQVIYISNADRGSWKLINPKANDALYVAMSLPGTITSDITTLRFAENVEGAYAEADRALDAALKNDTAVMDSAMEAQNVGAKGRTDMAIQMGRMLMGLGGYDLEECKLVQGISQQLANDIQAVDVALKSKDKTALENARTSLEVGAMAQGDKFDQMSEIVIVRGVAMHSIFTSYAQLQEVLANKVSPELKAEVVANGASARAQANKVLELLKEKGIDPAAVQQLDGLSDLGQIRAIISFLGRAVGKSWRGVKVVSKATGKVISAVLMPNQTTTLGKILSGSQIHTIVTGIVFAYAMDLYSKIKPMSVKVHEFKEQWRAQAVAQAEVAAETKANEVAVAGNVEMIRALNGLNPDPAVTAKANATAAQAVKYGIDVPGEQRFKPSTAFLVTASALAILGGAYYLKGRSLAEKN